MRLSAKLENLRETDRRTVLPHAPLPRPCSPVPVPVQSVLVFPCPSVFSPHDTVWYRQFICC